MPTKRKGATEAPPAPALDGLPHSEQLTLPIGDLKPHPRNYRQHPDDQLIHLKASIRQFGIYRNIVVAEDGTILAGHGVWQAAKELALDSLPVYRLDIPPDHPTALKLLIADNEVSHLVISDDRMLTDLLKSVQLEAYDGLLGTGYDELMLANLLMVTRPKSEIGDFDEAALWVGMPEYQPNAQSYQCIVSFPTLADRQAFATLHGVTLSDEKRVTSMWYPPKQGIEDAKHVKLEG